MKKRIVFIFAFSFFPLIIFAQKNNDKANTQCDSIEKAITIKKFIIDVNTVYPTGSNMITLSSTYNIKLSNDSAYIYLPYFGRAYSAPYGGDGGIKAENIYRNYSLQKQKKGKYIISFDIDGKDDKYKLYLNIWNNGTATVNVTSQNKQYISYSGNINIKY